ncbi:MAG: AAA family ATPase [Acidobacteriota bacterium]|nr:AAA family ATPase [Acidobacteriota bacterium]
MPWDVFLDRIESSVPPINALGITDYYSIDTYKEVLNKKKEGRIPKVELIFPNIEMRFGIGTGKGTPINVHLLVSPDDDDHIVQIQRFLNSLTFPAYEESYRCNRGDLIRLGRAYDTNLKDDISALSAGAKQFKVNFDQLREEWTKSNWIRENALIAVAAGSHDGTSGLQDDSSLTTLRKEIERTAHIIFSSQPKQRDFWLGHGAVSKEKLAADWNGCKPCLHGSDAHGSDGVGEPSLDRLCWIKGDLNFESLRQACLEPEARVFIGSTPPRGAMPSQVLDTVSVSQAPWLKTVVVPLNAGLVGIIGARGSGKTALADIIAAGGYSLSPHLSDKSFIQRAKALLGESTVRLTWEDGEPTSILLRNSDLEESSHSPQIQYLSQQFVDTLCSAEGVTDELLTEIERVIFQSHPSEVRLGATNFRELLDLQTAHGRAVRQSHERALAEIAQELSVEMDRKATLPYLRRYRDEKVKSIAKDIRDRNGLIHKREETHIQQLETVSAAAASFRHKIDLARRKKQALLELKGEVDDTRTSKSPLWLRQLQHTYAEAKLSQENWKAFLLDYVGDVDGFLGETIESINKHILVLSGPTKRPDELASSAPPATSLIPENAKLEEQTLRLLDDEITRLRALIGIEEQNVKSFARLSEKISRDEAILAKIDRDIQIAINADEQIKSLIKARRDSYAKVFEGIVEEEKELTTLYNPLKIRLEAEDGALGKLSFSVRRSVDVVAWAQHGEELLDLRKTGPFKGRGALLEAANAELLSVWEKGSSVEVAEAMARFRNTYEHGIIEHTPVGRDDPQAYREWACRISSWLYSTDHIKLTYGVQYEGVDIEQLSPGNRGIVLLLLYLAIDRDDDRPLIIDQPEENLDPKSIFDELVPRFRQAKLRRQIIIVTHNANLVVNSDADQVIVANCGPHRPNELPEISYKSGGLENPDIRRYVCDILEGGKTAFRERARRLRIRWNTQSN